MSDPDLEHMAVVQDKSLLVIPMPDLPTCPHHHHRSPAFLRVRCFSETPKSHARVLYTARTLSRGCHPRLLTSIPLLMVLQSCSPLLPRSQSSKILRAMAGFRVGCRETRTEFYKRVSARDSEHFWGVGLLKITTYRRLNCVFPGILAKGLPEGWR